MYPRMLHYLTIIILLSLLVVFERSRGTIPWEHPLTTQIKDFDEGGTKINIEISNCCGVMLSVFRDMYQYNN